MRPLAAPFAPTIPVLTGRKLDFQGDRIREGFAHDARTETEFPVKPAKILKQKIASGSLTLGALSTFHVWPGLVEIAKRAGLDYLIVDQEHFTHGHEKVAEICALGRLIDFPILIRPPAVELTHLRLAMDLGPTGRKLDFQGDRIREGFSDSDSGLTDIRTSSRGWEGCCHFKIISAFIVPLWLKVRRRTREVPPALRLRPAPGV